MEKIVNIWDELMYGVPNVVEALLLLIIAFICASIVKGLVGESMKLLRLDKILEKAKMDDEKKNSFKDFVAKLFYLITFALFVPGIFEKLGLEGIAEPVISMMDKFLVYLPNIVAALVLLTIGLFIAKAVKELLIPILKSLNIDNFLEKAGVSSDNKVTISDVIANTVYVIILVPVVIASLDALKVEAISKPATMMLNNIMIFMPRVLIAIVIVFTGKFISEIAGNLLEKVLVGIGTDRVCESIMKASGNKSEKEFSLSKTISSIVKCVIIIFFLVEGLHIIKLEVLTNIGNKVIEYMPYAISSLIIMLSCILAGNYAESKINEKFKDSEITALIVKVLIIIVGSFVTLYQLGIAKELVNSAFIIILGAFAIAFAISFGIGGREFASHMLDRVEKKISRK